VIARDWHPTKNGGLTPDQIVAGSDKKVWWKCTNGSDHEWETAVGHRTRDESGCPFCARQRVSVTNSLASLYPEIAKEWHPTRNGDLTPDQVVAGSGTKYWWLCPNGADHEWEASLGNRTGLERGCPFCSGHKVSVTNSLASLHPDIAREWHPTKNGNLTPDQIVAGSHQAIWWKCPKGPDHEWKAMLKSRTGLGTGCPCCEGLKVSITNSLACSYPHIAKEWHPTKNGHLTTDKVVAASNKKVWWNCASNPGHEWEATIVNRTRLGSGCPFCFLKPRSREEITLAFELLRFFEFDIDNHKLRTPGRVEDVDILIPTYHLGVEFDSAYWHRGKEKVDRTKTERLEAIGWRVIRVRQEPLKQIGPQDVVVPANLNLKDVANQVLLKVEEVCHVKIDGLGEYLRSKNLTNQRSANAYIAKLLEEKVQQPRVEAQ
jgi:very-short-patch-repair endonuclease